MQCSCVRAKPSRERETSRACTSIHRGHIPRSVPSLQWGHLCCHTLLSNQVWHRGGAKVCQAPLLTFGLWGWGTPRGEAAWPVFRSCRSNPTTAQDDQGPCHRYSCALRNHCRKLQEILLLLDAWIDDQLLCAAPPEVARNAQGWRAALQRTALTKQCIHQVFKIRSKANQTVVSLFAKWSTSTITVATTEAPSHACGRYRSLQ